ncbi:MAG: hypothetical protein FWH19_00010 [Treponema sp.]|nr:hypothetical protein [Treponema sp.]
MSNSGKAGSGRGNNRRRSFRRREGDSWQQKDNSAKPPDKGPAPENQNRPNRGGSFKKNNENKRSKWIPSKINPETLPVSDCTFCGKPIRDMTSAIADKDTGVPIHFDCVTSRIAFGEKLEKGESVVYIGGGRFGVVCFDTSRDSHGKAETRDFKIKKVIEWENKEKKAEWRSVICEHYSET